MPYIGTVGPMWIHALIAGPTLLILGIYASSFALGASFSTDTSRLAAFVFVGILGILGLAITGYGVLGLLKSRKKNS